MNKARRILSACVVIILLAAVPAGYAIGSVDQKKISQWVGVNAEDIGNVTLDDGIAGRGFLYKNVSFDSIRGCMDQLYDLGFTIQEQDADDDTVLCYLKKSDQQLFLMVYLDDSDSTVNMAVVFIENAGNTTSQIESMKTNTLIADVNGKTTVFEINISHNSGSGQMVDFVKNDVRGIVLEGIRLSLPGVIFAGDVIDSKAYNAARYGLCGITYYNRREASAQEAYNTKSNCDYRASFTYEMNNSSNYDEFFGTPAKLVMLPNSRASFTIYCDYMSADGYTYGGRFEALLIRGTDGKELTIRNGYFKFSTR